ncbi:MAG TPA: hypothetical protein VGW12_00160 [Pyrinomonadaceae bacterium]|nr:hypothetical protein [Pyrinomonadaceae bacterium]
MFEIFTTLIIQALAKVFGTSVDIIAKDVSWKRSMAATFMKLFDSLFELENDSRAVYQLLKRIADKESVPETVKFNESMNALFRSYEAFVKHLRDVESKLAIYNQDLQITISDMLRSKVGAWITIDMLLDAVPKIKEGEELVMIYPTNIPQGDLLEIAEASQGELEEQAKQIRKSVLEKFNRKAVDLRFPYEAGIAIRDAQDAFQKIQHAREQLAEFIRTNFPLKEMS